MKYYPLFSIFILLLTGCISLFPTPGEKLMSYASPIGGKVGKKYGISMSGTGASWPGEFKFVSIDYSCYREMEIEEARELIVRVAEDLLVLFNEKAAIDCQIDFKLENICVMIFFYNPVTGERIKSHTKMALVTCRRNEILYDIYPPGEDFTTIFREPYPEAYEKVMGHRRCGE